MNADLDRLLPTDGRALRTAFAAYPTGVVAVCTLVDGAPVGLAARSFASVSLDPPLVSVCAANESATWPLLRRGMRLGLSVFARDQAAVCRQLSRKNVDRFAGARWITTDAGAIFLAGAALWLETDIRQEIPAGDHSIVLLSVEAAHLFEEADPLAFLLCQMRSLPNVKRHTAL